MDRLHDRARERDLDARPRPVRCRPGRCRARARCGRPRRRGARPGGASATGRDRRAATASRLANAEAHGLHQSRRSKRCNSRFRSTRSQISVQAAQNAIPHTSSNLRPSGAKRDLLHTTQTSVQAAQRGMLHNVLSAQQPLGTSLRHPPHLIHLTDELDELSKSVGRFFRLHEILEREPAGRGAPRERPS